MAITLNDKPIWVGLAVGLGVALLLVGLTWYFYVSPTEERIKGIEGEIAEFDKKIEQGRAAERKLQQFRAEVDRLLQELEKLRRILPSTRNTEEIIQKLKALVDQGDFVLLKLTFPKLSGAKGTDPYAEWPITVAVDGRYHELARLFERLGNYSRIINVEQISVRALREQSVRTINASFVAKTFVYVEPAAEDPSAGKKKGKGKSKPGGKKKDEE